MNGSSCNCLLLIEPDQAQRDTLAHQLTQLGYQVIAVSDESQAINVIEAGQEIDLMLFPSSLAETACRQALSQRESSGILSHIAQLVIVDSDDIDRITYYIELGVEDYLQMPFNPVLWRARLDINLDKKRLYRQELARQENIKSAILPRLVDMSQERDVNRLLERIVIETAALCHADAGTLYLREDDTLKCAVMRTDSLNISLGGTSGQEVPLPLLRLHDDSGQPNEHIVCHVALHGQLVNIPDVYNTTDFDFSDTKQCDQRNGYRSVSSLTIPLKNHIDETIGVLQLFNAKDERTGQVIPFGSYQQQVAEMLVYQAALVLNNLILLERQQGWAKFERDLQIGHQIQMDFLPKQLPQLPGWEIAARFHPAREVAGDFYDAFTLSGNRLGLVVADVCDKGVGPALFMALSRTLVRAFAEQHRPLSWLERFSDEGSAVASPADRKQRNLLLSAGVGALLAVELTNDYITTNHGDMNMFVTLFLGILDPATGVLTYVNGGHDPPAVIGADGTLKTFLKPTGPAVGMLPDVGFEIAQVTLEVGDLLLAYSDGVPDARSPEGKWFTKEKFLALLAQPGDPSVEATLERIDAALFDHIATADQFDDITMLAVRRC
jgi:sigma-B regulation protein RsbU (phosphoserine phosphatase)